MFLFYTETYSLYAFTKKNRKIYRYATFPHKTFLYDYHTLTAMSEDYRWEYEHLEGIGFDSGLYLPDSEAISLKHGDESPGKIHLFGREAWGPLTPEKATIVLKLGEICFPAFYNHIENTKGIDALDRQKLLEMRDNFFQIEDIIPGLTKMVNYMYRRSKEEAESFRKAIKSLGGIESSIGLALNIRGMEGVEEQLEELIRKIRGY